MASDDCRVSPVTSNFSSNKALMVDLPTFPPGPMTNTDLIVDEDVM